MVTKKLRTVLNFGRTKGIVMGKDPGDGVGSFVALTMCYVMTGAVIICTRSDN